MPNFQPLEFRPLGGLNLKEDADALKPGEAVTARNVFHSENSVSSRHGKLPQFSGQKDDTIRGGPTGESLYVQGDQHWLEHDELTRDRTAHDYRDEDTSFHHRHGLIMLPEGQLPALRLDPSKLKEWGVEMALWTDDFTGRQIDPDDLDSDWLEVGVICKHDDGETQWDIRLVPETDKVTNNNRYFVALTLYAGATTGNGFKFFVNNQHFHVGKRHWVGWRMIERGVDDWIIRSYFLQEGMTEPATRDQAIDSSLTTTGTESASGRQDWPMTIGRRPARRKITSGNRWEETGYNGVLTELRFWFPKDERIKVNIPDWTSNWFWFESLSQTLIEGYAFHYDLHLYHTLRPQDANPQDLRQVRSAYPSPLANYLTRVDPESFTGWLTGADAVWVDANGGRMGRKALAILPTCCVTGQEAVFYRQVSIPREIYGGGLRVPNGNLYLQKKRDGTTEWDFPQGFTVRVSFQLEFLELTNGGDPITLFQSARIRQGGATLEHEYLVASMILLTVRWSATKWVLDVRIHDSAGGGFTTITGTTALDTEGTEEHTAFVVMRDGGSERVAHLYLDGNIEGTSGLVTAGPINLSQSTGSDVLESNNNDADGREDIFPTYIGCRVETESASAPDPYLFVKGAPYEVGYRETGIPTSTGTPDTGVARLGWSFHSNDVNATPNDGVGYRGWHGCRGRIGSVHIWKMALSEVEIGRFDDRLPNESEITSYGERLLSAWDFEEGVGSVAWDKGHLGNHIRFQQFPNVRSVCGPVRRRKKAPVRGVWEVRTSTPREGVKGRDIFALAGGSLLAERYRRGQGSYLEVIAPRLWDKGDLPPTGFTFSDFFYLCTGTGPVMRVSRGKVTTAGLSPAQGLIQGDHLGWVEVDRDGTFQVVQNQAAAEADAIFEVGEKYEWLVTWFDADAAVESVPSRQIAYTIEDIDTSHSSVGGNGFGSDKVTLHYLPKPRERNATHYRIYRTPVNTGVFRFVDQIPISSPSYVDTTPDSKLGRSITSNFNYPPPMDCRIGLSIGTRAMYLGSSSRPGTAWVSLAGKPDCVPPTYEVTPVPGNQNELTGAVPFQSRTLLFLQDATYIVTDHGSDISPNSFAQTIPFSVESLWENTGCVSHHTIVTIEGVGIVFASERGIHVTNGQSAQYVSDKISTLYESLNRSTYRKWHAVHHRWRNAYVLFAVKGDSNAKNPDIAIVWDYTKNIFSTLEGFEAIFSTIIEERETGENQLWITDPHGRTWQMDPRQRLSDDGASGSGAQDLVGVIPENDSEDDPTTTQRIKIVENNELPTYGDALIGVPLKIFVVSNGLEFSESRTILWNDSNYVEVDRAFSGMASQLPGRGWELGSIRSLWRSGKYQIGPDRIPNRIQHVGLNWNPLPKASPNATITLDEQPPQTFGDISPDRERTMMSNILGRGRRVEVAIGDSSSQGTWELTQVDIGYLTRGKGRWTAKASNA